MLGIGVPDSQDSDNSASHRERVRAIATYLEGRILQYLLSNGVRPEHSVQPGRNDGCKIIHLRWEPPVPANQATAKQAQLTITLEVATELSQTQIEQALELRMESDGEAPTALLALPHVFDRPGVEDTVFDNAIEGLKKLAVKIGQSGPTV